MLNMISVFDVLSYQVSRMVDFHWYQQNPDIVVSLNRQPMIEYKRNMRNICCVPSVSLIADHTVALVDFVTVYAQVVGGCI